MYIEEIEGNLYFHIDESEVARIEIALNIRLIKGANYSASLGELWTLKEEGILDKAIYEQLNIDVSNYIIVYN
jgi:hypothetical protein